MASDLGDVKYEVAVANRVLQEMGLASGILATLGHASMRVPSNPDTFVVKGRGYPVDVLGRMQPDDMVVCDLEGYKVGGRPEVTQCFEIKMHSCIYKLRPEVQSVVHVHPRFATLLSVLGKRIVPMCKEASQLVRYPIPIFPHMKTIETEDEGMGVAKMLGGGPVILLLGHGATTVGASLEEAVMNMLGLEEQARMNWYAYCAAGPDHPYISEELVEEDIARPDRALLPHFNEPMGGGQPRVNGVWKWYCEKVSGSL